MTTSRELNEETFIRLTLEMPPPPTPDTIRVRARSSQQRRRVAAGVAVVVCVIGAVVGDIRLRTTPATRVIFSADPGSIGMPPTFVAADPSGNVYVLDSSTGKVIRALYRHAAEVGFGTLTADAQDVFVSDEQGIHQVPRAGGHATLLSPQSATVMAVNPDGTSLAWASASPVAGPSRTKPILTVNVTDLKDHSTRRWTLTPPDPSLSPPGSDSPYYDSAYHIFQLGWTSPNHIAAVISSALTSGGSQTVCSAQQGPPATTCTQSSIPSQPPAHPLLVTFDTSTGAMSPQLDIPTPDAGGLVAGAHFLTAGPTPGSIVTAISPGEGSPSRLVELTVEGSTVTIRTLLQLPGTQFLPQSLDPDGHDLLLSAPSGGAWTFLRSTDHKAPTPITSVAKWSAYASW